MSDLTSLSASDLAAVIRARRVSATEVMGVYLDRIDQVNPSLNAVLHVDPERSLAAAARADGFTGPRGRLHGVPITLKDSHRVAGMPTVVGNPDASRAAATSDGFVAQRLRAEGAIVIGKTNVAGDLADFQTDNSIFGRTRHPSDPALTPGGSSGGAAAAVAARLTPIEIGSDIAGSVRVPAHFTGIIGFKPSPGLVSRRGHVTQPVMHPRGGGVNALATIGPMARTFDDILLLTRLLGNLKTMDQIEPSTASLGVITELPGLRVQGSIRDAVISLAKSADGSGMRVEPVEPPLGSDEQHEAWVEVYQAARTSGRNWPKVARAADRQTLALRAWEHALRRHDAIILPPAMCVAFSHRPAGTPIDVDGVPVPYWGLTRYTEPFNLTGHPAIVIPANRDGDGLPIGVQVVAGLGRDGHLLNLAAWLGSLGQAAAPSN
jgi:amidase